MDYQYPVYACGYNWLRDNSESGNEYAPNSLEYLESSKENGNNYLFGPSDLNSRIDHALKECNAEQFLIVSHSMGGLVTRAYAKQATGDAPKNTKNGDKLCGIFHGVMPATGAPAFYKRLKAGFGDEPNPCNWKWYDYINPLSYVKMGLTSLKDGAVAKLLGSTARETSPILLNAPGAMQLMPATAVRILTPGWIFTTTTAKPKYAASTPKTSIKPTTHGTACGRRCRNRQNKKEGTAIRKKRSWKKPGPSKSTKSTSTR